jgi:hypothetical protein
MCAAAVGHSLEHGCQWPRHWRCNAVGNGAGEDESLLVMCHDPTRTRGRRDDP